MAPFWGGGYNMQPPPPPPILTAVPAGDRFVHRPCAGAELRRGAALRQEGTQHRRHRCSARGHQGGGTELPPPQNWGHSRLCRVSPPQLIHLGSVMAALGVTPSQTNPFGVPMAALVHSPPNSSIWGPTWLHWVLPPPSSPIWGLSWLHWG